MPTPKNVCDHRICIRLPHALVEHIARTCSQTETHLSAFVRRSLVNELSRRTQWQQWQLAIASGSNGS